MKETMVVDKLGVWQDTVSYYIFGSHGPSVGWSQVKFGKFAPEGQIPRYSQVFLHDSPACSVTRKYALVHYAVFFSYLIFVNEVFRPVKLHKKVRKFATK